MFWSIRIDHIFFLTKRKTSKRKKKERFFDSKLKNQNEKKGGKIEGGCHIGFYFLFVF